MSMPMTDRPTFPEIYERELVAPLFRPWVDLLLDGAKLVSGDAVLDVACGTGIVARVARERLGPSDRVVGVDLSPLMIAQARTLAPGIDFREGSADALPLLEGERFDVVACQQGLQFFPDKPRATAEIRRALRKGGRAALATWRPIEEAPFFAELQEVAERHVGPIVDARHGFGDSGELARLLGDVGFSDIDVRTHERTIRFGDGATFARLNAMAVAGMSERGKGLGEGERMRLAEAIVADSADVLRRYADGAGVAFRLATNVAIAVT